MTFGSSVLSSSGFETRLSRRSGSNFQKNIIIMSGEINLKNSLKEKEKWFTFGDHKN